MQNTVDSCTKCPGLCPSRTRIVFPCSGNAGLLAIGEAPGEEEDTHGIGFVGRAGKTLDAALAEHGISRQNYGQANICRCRPPNNRRPLKTEIDACLPYLAEFIRTTEPRALLLVGRTAVEPFFGNGPLLAYIEASRRPGGGVVDPRVCHPALRELAASRAIVAIPMPHTSGLAWNRAAPNGQRWSDIGKEQIRLACEYLSGNFKAKS